MVWSSHLFQNFPQFVVIHTVKGFSVVNEAEVYAFLKFTCFFCDPTDVGNLISGSSAFSKSSFYVWKLGMGLTEAEDIKKRWQEYTEELYKKDLHDQGNHDGVITHLEPDILECEVKWALESITTNKASGGDGIPVELFQNLKDDGVKVLHSICQQIWKTQQ